MPPPDPISSPNRSSDGQFEVTRWSIVLAARGDAPAARNALEFLCENYWYPLYAFARRQGCTPHDAQDLTQGFFAKFLEKDYLDGVAREKGKFRSFLLASMKHFMANERDRAGAHKRGGGRSPISLDAHSAESRYAMEPVDGQTPEKIFDRRWALTVLDQALVQLRAEFSKGGRTALFEALKPTLTGHSTSYGVIAGQLGMSEGAVKVAVHRLRQRYRAILRGQIAQTVGSEAEVDEELRDLMAAISG